jgi:hypothetical protein
MAALDAALRRAEQAAGWLGWSGQAASPLPDRTEPDTGSAEPSPDAVP